ncbi:hypothetical protein [Streptomyces sp. MJP52]|uniref:hypothetical protein n=1 Tax=Streptomyces sp. MJP52 TaxID=2940555 RepID=UPI002474ED42|nr:hypothetical protein [Streptomyces sp. MJP52]MDH6229364.1 hypothetical protein [Streptomyces sp. MJP52]
MRERTSDRVIRWSSSSLMRTASIPSRRRAPSIPRWRSCSAAIAAISARVASMRACVFAASDSAVASRAVSPTSGLTGRSALPPVEDALSRARSPSSSRAALTSVTSSDVSPARAATPWPGWASMAR